MLNGLVLSGSCVERVSCFPSFMLNVPRAIQHIGRPGSDADMAACVLWLAGPGGVFMNGQIVYLDGGEFFTIVLSQPFCPLPERRTLLVRAVKLEH